MMVMADINTAHQVVHETCTEVWSTRGHLPTWRLPESRLEWTSTCVHSVDKCRCCVCCKSFKCKHLHPQASHVQGLLRSIVVWKLEIAAFHPSHPCSLWSRCDSRASCGRRRRTYPVSTVLQSAECCEVLQRMNKLCVRNPGLTRQFSS